MKGVEGFSDLRLRRAGPFILGEVKIRVGETIDVKKAHEISDKIEKEVKEKINEIISFSIHIEPKEREEVKIVIPITANKGMNSIVMDHFGRASNFFFAFVDKKKKEIKDFYVKENPFKLKSVKAGLSVTKFLLNECRFTIF